MLNCRVEWKELCVTVHYFATVDVYRENTKNVCVCMRRKLSRLQALPITSSSTNRKLSLSLLEKEIGDFNMQTAHYKECMVRELKGDTPKIQTGGEFWIQPHNEPVACGDADKS